MGTPGDYDHLNYDELHGRCRQRGYARQGSEADLMTRLATIDAVERKCNCGVADAMDTS